MTNDKIIEMPEDHKKVRMWWRDKSADEALDILTKLKDTGLVSKVDVIVQFTNEDFVVDMRKDGTT